MEPRQSPSPLPPTLPGEHSRSSRPMRQALVSPHDSDSPVKPQKPPSAAEMTGSWPAQQPHPTSLLETARPPRAVHLLHQDHPVRLGRCHGEGGDTQITCTWGHRGTGSRAPETTQAV